MRKEIYVDLDAYERFHNNCHRLNFSKSSCFTDAWLSPTFTAKDKRKRKKICKKADEIWRIAKKLLSPKQYKIFVAVFRDGVNYSVYARINGISRQAAATHFYRGLEKVRGHYGIFNKFGAFNNVRKYDYNSKKSVT